MTAPTRPATGGIVPRGAAAATSKDFQHDHQFTALEVGATPWIWDGKDIQTIDANFRKYRSLVPEKPTLLGIYMWDFGGKKELSKELMAQQLDYAYRLYKEGQIDGLIFHCTPLCNKGLAAVDYARQWIAKHGEEGRSPA